MPFTIKQLASIFLVTGCVFAHAVMPPFFEARASLERMNEAADKRNQATDVVLLRVTSVQAAVPRALGCPTWQRWKLEGEVLQAIRGQFKSGSTVSLEHVWEHYDCPGPVRESIPDLKPAMETEAYLRCTSDGRCSLSADAMSFMSAQAFELEKQKREEELRKHQRP